MPAAVANAAIPQDEVDILDSFQPAYERLKAEADACAATQAEVLRVATEHRDELARLRALIDKLPLSLRPLMAKAQRRITRAEQRVA